MLKKLLSLVLFVMLVFGAFAEGASEEMTITVVGVGVTGATYAQIYDDLKTEFPFVTAIDAYESDLSTGEDITMTALLAAGDPPDVYTDFAGRAGKYVTPAFALPLNIDESVWFDDQIAPYKRGGKLYALPQPTPGQAMAVNVSFLEGIGVEIPSDITEGWTVDTFLRMCQAVKEANVDGVYGTGLFAASPSADYLWVNWFASFGVTSFFKDDYTASRADEPEFLATWQFFDTLMQEGFIHPNSALWGAGDFLKAIGTGRMIAYGARMGWPGGMQSNYNADGEHYEWLPVPFPTLDGAPAMTAAGGHIVVGHKSDAARAQVVTWLVEAMAGKELQTSMTRNGNIPTRRDVPEADAYNKGEDLVVWLAQNVGILDVGFPNSWYYETRSTNPSVLQPLLKGEITPEEAARIYFEKITAIVNGD